MNLVALPEQGGRPPPKQDGRALHTTSWRKCEGTCEGALLHPKDVELARELEGPAVGGGDAEVPARPRNIRGDWQPLAQGRRHVGGCQHEICSTRISVGCVEDHIGSG